jgi:hypothetical protein
MVGIDSNVLSLLLYPAAKPPKDPSTGKPVTRMPERVQFLLETLDADGETIVIPTPVLSEFLILADKNGPDYLATIHGLKTMIIGPFDERACIELAALEIADRGAGDKRGGSSSPWQKIKVDRQIVAIAKINLATAIYSDDPDIRKLATKAGMKSNF